MNLDAMLKTWDEQFGRAAYLPNLIGPRNAPARAAILSALYGMPVSRNKAGIALFRSETAKALGVDMNQCSAGIDSDIMAKFHAELKARNYPNS